MPTPKIQSTFVGGLEVLSCLPQGRCSATPLLFIHGAFAGAWIWADNFLPYFAAAGYPCYALSLRGHGESAGRERIDWLSITDYVDDLTKVVNWLGQPPVLIGHSMGGFVAQKYLEHRSAPAAALVCSVPPQGLVMAQFHLMFQKPGLFMEMNNLLSGRQVSLEVIREALFAEPVDNVLLNKFFTHMQMESQRALWDMSMFNLPHLVMRKRPPLLVLGAEKDVLVPAFLVQATARTYGVPDHIFRGMGHGVTHERDWRKVADYLRDWLHAGGF
ncbi:MAG: hypothetical protein RIR00_1669 [Pseudomonadota bacterium]|jgi:non-heme chloroperoxidase